MGRRTIKRGPGQRRVASKNFRLADEVRYIQHRAAEHDARFVAIGWKGHYHIDGKVFVYIDRDSGRLVSILGYPASHIAKLG